MIDKVELRGFKNHVHTVLTLGRLTVLTGANNSGKTGEFWDAEGEDWVLGDA